MQQTVEEIEREFYEGQGRTVSQERDISTMNPWLDPDWWEEYYGEEIEP